ncbi:hypothetical protein [Castellaniella sp. MT123]|uniref:hypothetical protein n=1 Tax=Castellaniella sp. MT123 TaxID=3140381 RepID=UPI0031F4043D
MHRHQGGILIAQHPVDEARAQLRRYQRQVANDLNALRLLVGGPLPTDLPSGLNIQDVVLAQMSWMRNGCCLLHSND